MAPPPKLLDQVRNKLRVKHYSIRSEQSYVDWIKRYILFHGKQHPKNLGARDLEAFLTHLAVAGKVAAATQNQALGAFVSLRLSSAHAQPASHFQPGLRFGHAPWVFAVARLLRVVACRSSRCVSSCRRITSADFLRGAAFRAFYSTRAQPGAQADLR